MSTVKTIIVKDSPVSIVLVHNMDYISLKQWVQKVNTECMLLKAECAK